jgi:signal transduction histidine kinase/CheY-like chemotaxis protein
MINHIMGQITDNSSIQAPSTNHLSRRNPLHWFLNHLSIGIRINLTVFVVLLLLVGATVVFLNKSVQKLTIQTEREQARKEADIIQVQLATTMQELETSAQVLANSVSLVDSVHRKDRQRAETSVLVGASSFTFDDVDVMDQSKRRLVDWSRAQNTQREDYYLDAGSRGLPIRGVIYDEIEKRVRLVVAIPIRDEDAIVGVLLASRWVDETFLDEIAFQREDIHPCILYDGDIITFNKTTIQQAASADENIGAYYSAVLMDQLAIDEALKGNVVVSDKLLALKRIPHALAYIPLNVRNQTYAVVGLLVGYDHLHIFLKQFTNGLTIIFILLALGALVVMTLFIRHNVATPLNKLRFIAERMANGDYTQQAEKKTYDEIGKLATAFNTMATAVQEREQSLHQLATSLEERNSELRVQTKEAYQARVAAEEANVAKSQFLANMSHELRTPLNAIIGYSEMLYEEAEESDLEDFVPDLQKIHTAGKHLLNLINDILDFSKIEAGKMELYIELFDLNMLVEDVVSTMKPLISQKNNTFKVECQSALGKIHADQTKVRQVLFNMLSNAAKFTEQGTIIFKIQRSFRYETATASDATPDAQQVIQFAEEHVLFQIHDTGIGMTAEQSTRLFHAFTQADASTTRKYGGTGLGLAISRRFCQMMGGDIVVESTASHGSTFTVYIPVHVRDPKHEQMQIEQHEETNDIEHESDERSVSGTILVIDDDETSRELIRHFLGQEGYRIITASSGEEGLAMAKKVRPNLIMLDVIMPRMDGWAVLNALHHDHELSTIPVIIVTIIDEKPLGFALGATDYLVKPIDRSRLTQVLSKYKMLSTRSDNALLTRSGNTLLTRPDNAEKTVLVVEDDLAAREVMRRTLEKEGWRVSEAENGQLALEQIERQCPDIILLDLMMPKMDGFQLIKTLRATPDWKNIPVIVVTAKQLTEEDRKQLQGSVDQTIQKGMYNKDALLHEVQHLVLAHMPSDDQTKV